ncbi:glycosyltransferase family 4 protein [Falsiroseomonas selenitidurans]|uniref:Glycosyltransferase family 4 protein n=1 Tax=Falsiroseomonas selenitidurans TaxID=2716335 RepID=A0ABX1E0G8_9PROT|nr:glycosyltransferase family 4 protein [Falsiroseomonas selenitidurans]NKC30646.1 glycosyltransferase family 4 protein [Falsiroseomonas selenitidurans]
MVKRILAQAARLGGRLRAHAALLRRDPQAFAGNVMQVTHPDLFRERLVDIMNPVPMHVRVDPALGEAMRLNVLNPALTEDGMTGGPNTILNLAVRIARQGIPVRLVTTVRPGGVSAPWLRQHLAALVGGAIPEIAVETAALAEAPLAVGPGEVFMATHWTTAQQLKPVLPRMRRPQFLYMLQEFEAGFYAWSSNHALALETYGMDFWPITNETLLAEYFFRTGHGRFADPAFRERSMAFEPAIESRVFHPPEGPAPPGPRTLLFYARPSNHRNLFGLGLEALRRAAADPALAGWRMLAIGGRGGVPELDLGHGHVLRASPWRGYLAYADQLREADVLLAPMLSPHTGYPALEMAACGGVAVTNAFSVKTVPVLEGLSPNIVATEATVEGLSAGLVRAARMVADGRAREGTLHLPRDWAEALDPVARRVAEVLRGAG